MTGSHGETDYEKLQDDERRVGQALIENRLPVDRWRVAEFIAAVKQYLCQRAIEQWHKSHRAQDMPGEAFVFANNQHQLLYFP